MEFVNEPELINRIEISSVSDLNIENVQKRSKDEKMELVFNLGIYDEDSVKRIKYLVKELKEKNYNIPFILIKADNRRFTVTDMVQFSLLEKDLKDNDILLRFDGGVSQSYDISDVMVAQSRLNIFIDEIKRLNLSPFEKYLLVYDFLTRKVYRDNEDKSKARDLIALMNGDDIVCVGYAQLMEYFCNELGIKCIVQNCKIYSPNEKFMFNHQNNIVYIDDDKYNIHGMFYSDACWDHVEKGYENKRTYSFCLIPLKDKDNMNRKIKIDDDTMFYYPDHEYMLKLVDGEYYGSPFGRNFDGEFSKIIKKMGLEEKYSITEAMVKDNCQNSLRRKYACEELRKVFKEERVPGDIYRSKSSVPYGTSFDFLLSMYMFNEIDKNFIVDRIKTLKRYYSSSRRLDITESARSYVYDVYKELDDLEFESVQDSIIENEGSEVRWEMVESKITKTIMAGFVYNNLEKGSDLKPGEPIPIEKYKKALREVYECQGIPNEKIDEVINEAVKNTKRLANKAFVESASNSFKQEVVKESMIEFQGNEK